MHLSNFYRRNKAVAAAVVAVLVAMVAIALRHSAWEFLTGCWDQAISWGVNPVIFLVLLLGTTYHYYKGWFMIARGVFKRDQAEFMRGAVLNRATWAIPWAYVVVFGHGYPQWVLYMGVATLLLLVGWFAYNARRPEYIHKMTRSPIGRLVGRRLKLNDEGKALP